MKSQKQFNLLSSIRSKYRVITRMIPLSVKIWGSVSYAFAMNNILSMGRVTKLAERVKFTKMFVDFVLNYNDHHGPEATVKWLKACLVSLQKELGQDRVVSMQSLGCEAPYSRLTGGLPRLIPSRNRKLIRQGDPREIRFWTGLFNLYRILDCKGKLKTSTITDPYSGSVPFLMECINRATDKNGLFFDTLKGFRKITSESLEPNDFMLSRAASPSNKQSYTGILTDIYLLSHYQPILWKALMDYLFAVDQSSNGKFFGRLDYLKDYIDQLMKFDGGFTGKSGKQYSFNVLSLKASLIAHGYSASQGQGLSQFALKKEAAGKIRLFALIDSITQTILSPLHEMLFDLLKAIPNDGTFDQDASVIRSQVKATASNCAYSFDLTAATDRLPAKLTAQIIAGITGKDIAVFWWRIMTGRSFWFNGKVVEEHKVSEGPYHYAVGQPMGALSSWAGLAVTHHWIVQLAAFQVTGSYNWNLQYEILGDDLVIFDKQIADKYLQIMTDLGCEINLFKSIVSHNRPVFEFAKRTCWGMNTVSGISLAGVRAGWNVGGRANNALAWLNSGLITSNSVLAMTLSRYISVNGKSSWVSIFERKSDHTKMKLLSLGILSVLGAYHESGKLSLKQLMTAIIRPDSSGGDISAETVGLPLRASLNVISDISRSTYGPYQNFVFSKQSQRDDVFEESKALLAGVMMTHVYYMAEEMVTELPKWVNTYSESLTRSPFCVFNESPIGDSHLSQDGLSIIQSDDFPDELNRLLKQRVSIAEAFLGLDHTDSHPSYIQSLVANYIKNNCVDLGGVVGFEWRPDDKYYEELKEIANFVESLRFKLCPNEVAAPNTTVLESAPILAILRKLDLTKHKWQRVNGETPFTSA